MAKQTTGYNNYVAIRWGGYCGEDGIVATKHWPQGTVPTARQLCRFTGARDPEHCLATMEEGYWEMYQTGDMASGRYDGTLRRISLSSLAKLLGLPKQHA